jgi:hypothetical protein
MAPEAEYPATHCSLASLSRPAVALGWTVKDVFPTLRDFCHYPNLADRSKIKGEYDANGTELCTNGLGT